MIFFDVNQDILVGGRKFPQARAKEVAKTLSRALSIKSEVPISVAFVSEKEMKRLNKTHRGKNSVTDVLSFRLDNEDYMGELVLSYEQAARQAKEMRHSVRDEIVFLLVHGVLHLHGFDHEQELGAKEMFALQTKILVRLDVDPRI